MATYLDLVNDVRLYGPANRTQLDANNVARAIYSALVAIIAEVAELSPSWPLLPREIVDIENLDDLHEGLRVQTSQGLTRIAHVDYAVETGARADVFMVLPKYRNGPLPTAASFPAAYLAGERIHPIPQPGSPWTHESILNAGWSVVRSVKVEAITLIAAPTAAANIQAQQVPAHVQFHRPAVMQVANKLFPSPVLLADYQHELRHLRGQAGRGAAPTITTIGDVF